MVSFHSSSCFETRRPIAKVDACRYLSKCGMRPTTRVDDRGAKCDTGIGRISQPHCLTGYRKRRQLIFVMFSCLFFDLCIELCIFLRCLVLSLSGKTAFEMI